LIRNVIFDLDGTLIDSVEAHAQAWSRAFAAFGKHVPVEDVRQQIGKGGDQLMPVFLTPEEESAFGEALEAHRGRVFRQEYLPRVRPFPMVVPLFERLVQDGKRVALGSSSAKEDLDHFIGLLGIRRFLDASTNADDVEASKPEPDVFLEALRRLGRPRKDDVIVVGDAPWDAIAADRAGLRTIGLLGGGFSEEQLRTAGCVEVYQDVADLFADYEHSALA
jgi:phosphoglycolate phosphatase-like HAD superfamily hydrolase